ncbi:MAG: hypothetical protein JWN93_781 [Hyphomicrobiales bacterium]|nr:hypothetical protein [Hyphomicrobiales bacterium]
MKLISFAAVLLATSALASVAQAQTIAALVGDDTLAMVDAAAKKVTGTVKITGASGKVVGIDVRPADGMLYAVSSDGLIWTLDAKTGKATQKSKLDMMLPADAMMSVDFNPVADRLRVISSGGLNLRINADDGKVTKDGDLKFAETDMHKGETPKVVAGAYTNSMKGAKETVLYDIDATIGALLKQAPPNDGVLGAVGKLGAAPASFAFDIASDGKGGNDAWLMADGALHKVDLVTGKAVLVGKIEGAGSNVRDIAIMPKM